MKPFILIPHTADLEIEVYGNTMQELFINALRGMFYLKRPRRFRCDERGWCEYRYTRPVQHDINIESTNYEFLLVDFLSDALSLSDIYKEIYHDFVFKDFSSNRITGTLIGYHVFGFALDIKAVTYHTMAITQHDDHWSCRIVFDI